MLGYSRLGGKNARLECCDTVSLGENVGPKVGIQEPEQNVE